MLANGDNGSDSCNDRTIAADWPVASPSVVAVGGTTLTVGADGVTSEVAWSGSGGTSMAAPQWSGFLALVNESRSNAKKNSGRFFESDSLFARE